MPTIQIRKIVTEDVETKFAVGDIITRGGLRYRIVDVDVWPKPGFPKQNLYSPKHDGEVFYRYTEEHAESTDTDTFDFANTVEDRYELASEQPVARYTITIGQYGESATRSRFIHDSVQKVIEGMPGSRLSAQTWDVTTVTECPDGATAVYPNLEWSNR